MLPERLDTERLQLFAIRLSQANPVRFVAVLAHEPLPHALTSYVAKANLAASAVGGKLYVLGGTGTSGMVSDVEVYDPLSTKRAVGIGGKLTHWQQFCVGSNAKLVERRAPMPPGWTGFSVAVSNGILGIWLRTSEGMFHKVGLDVSQFAPILRLDE
jgi:hypothetical protein